MSKLEDPTVENAIREALDTARARSWVDLGGPEAERLVDLVRTLLKWNRTFNLTSITEPRKVAELHVLDSLALAPHLETGSEVLDVGSGAGFPGLPMAIARADTRWTLVDRTEKKVAFMKNAIARLGIENARALHLRLGGDPRREGLERFDTVVSRAFTAPEKWLPFASAYARPGGRVIAMLGNQIPDLDRLAEELGLERGSFEELAYRLPSGASRGLLIWTTPSIA